MSRVKECPAFKNNSCPYDSKDVTISMKSNDCPAFGLNTDKKNKACPFADVENVSKCPEFKNGKCPMANITSRL